MVERGELLELGSDLSLRYRYFSRESLAHPAKLHLGLLAWLLDRYTKPGDTIADPMAGIGSTAYAALLQRHVMLREIEPKWLAFAHENAAIILREGGMFAGTINIAQADARLPWGYTADHIIFSPPYACAVASTPTAKGMTSHQIRARLAGVEGGYDKAWDRLLRAYDSGRGGVVAAYVMHYGQHPAPVLGGVLGDSGIQQKLRLGDARHHICHDGMDGLDGRHHPRCGEAGGTQRRGKQTGKSKTDGR